MKIVGLSDTHNQHHVVSDWGWLPPADVLVHAGDMSLRGTEGEVKSFLEWFFGLEHYKHKILIAGNHDFIFERQPKFIESIEFPENVHYLQDSGIEIDGVNFWGSPIQPWFHSWAFNRDRGKDIRKHWEMIPLNTNILITHGPPYKILDEVLYESTYNPEKNVGCVDLSEKIKQLKDLKAMFFGHIHEAYGTVEENGVKYFNASFLDRKYRPTNKPHVVEI